jgi:PAS domain S-box-containing protein
MRDDPARLLTPINPDASAPAGLTSGRLLIVLFPVITVGLVTVAVAVAAALAGFYPQQMLLTAAGIGAVLALPALVLLFRQRSERTEAQRALLGARARVGGIVESAMDAIITIDARQRVVQFNAAAQKAFLWPGEAILGQPVDVLIPERYRAAHRQHVERFGHTAVTSRGMGSQTVLHGLRSTGEEFPIEASISQHEEGGEKFYTVILRDVTQRMEADERLARGEARLRGILESAMDAVITIDEEQRIVLFNQAAEEVFGCPRREAIGAPLDGFIPERFRQGHRRLVEQFGTGRESSRRMGHARVVMGLRRNGEEFPIEASISQVAEGGQHLYTVILRDVTQRVRAEEALRASREELREFAVAANSVREQEKSRIARELHDELGQALTALKLDVSWLRERATGSAPEVERKLASMQRLLDDTVGSARRISSELRPLMLDDLGLVAAAEWLVQNFMQRTGIPCELVVGTGGFDLPDPYATAIFRVLQESLTNATKHSEATQVEATLVREEDQIVLTVIDNGRGFDAAAPRKGSSHGHTGLRERAYLLGGGVSIESEPGRGTKVELRLPAPPEEPAR